MSESSLRSGIYKADVSGNTERRIPRMTYIVLIGEVLQKGWSCVVLAIGVCV